MNRTISLGCAAGMLVGTATALVTMLLIPEAGFGVWSIDALPALSLWALLFGWLPGCLLGATAGFAVWRYYANLRSIQSRLGLAAAGSVIAIGVSELLLPVAWDLPRWRIGSIVGLSTFTLGWLMIELLCRVRVR